MTKTDKSHHDGPAYYRIRVQGALDRHWSGWFGGMTITREANGETTLAGPVVDQAALFGLIARVRDLGLTLLTVTAGEPDGDS